MKIKVYLNICGDRRFVGILDDKSNITFQYDPEFLDRKISLSPFAVPLSDSIWQSKSSAFSGLPGFIADSLPDGWGNFLLDRHLKKLGKNLLTISPLERLSWIGIQGMGALEYEPCIIPDQWHTEQLEPDSLFSEICKIQETWDVSDIEELRKLTGSSGGARPKIVCLLSNDAKTIKPGAVYEAEFSPWIIKFRNSIDKLNIGVHEYICSEIARSVGVDIPETKLLPSKKGRGWFAIKRFDRAHEGKVHMSTFAALAECDFRIPCADYVTILSMTQRLCGQKFLPELLLRSLLNFALGNSDDHAKNFSFVMDSSYTWKPSPVYDLVPNLAEKHPEHMTSFLGKGKNICLDDVYDVGKRLRLNKKDVSDAIDKARAAVAMYPKLSKEYGIKVPPSVDKTFLAGK